MYTCTAAFDEAPRWNTWLVSDLPLKNIPKVIIDTSGVVELELMNIVNGINDDVASDHTMVWWCDADGTPSGCQAVLHTVREVRQFQWCSSDQRQRKRHSHRMGQLPTARQQTLPQNWIQGCVIIINTITTHHLHHKCTSNNSVVLKVWSCGRMTRLTLSAHAWTTWHQKIQQCYTSALTHTCCQWWVSSDVNACDFVWW